MDNVIGYPLAVWDEYPKEEKENGELGGEDDGVVDDLDYVCQLGHNRLVMLALRINPQFSRLTCTHSTRSFCIIFH